MATVYEMPSATEPRDSINLLPFLDRSSPAPALLTSALLTPTLLTPGGNEFDHLYPRWGDEPASWRVELAVEDLLEWLGEDDE